MRHSAVEGMQSPGHRVAARPRQNTVDYEARDPLFGTTLNDAYRVERLVAEGGMGLVYAGEQLRLGRTVAIKVLRQPIDDQFGGVGTLQVGGRTDRSTGAPSHRSDHRHRLDAPGHALHRHGVPPGGNVARPSSSGRTSGPHGHGQNRTAASVGIVRHASCRRHSSGYQARERVSGQNPRRLGFRQVARFRNRQDRGFWGQDHRRGGRSWHPGVHGAGTGNGAVGSGSSCGPIFPGGRGVHDADGPATLSRRDTTRRRRARAGG